MDKVHWLLPEGIDETVPPQAAHLETVRRDLLDLFSSWGYELVIPPFIEFLDSLLMGAGADIDLKTFKLTDQLSGRLMGIRADMTTQVARIDAHHLENDAPSRLCYMGTVLHTRPDGFGGTRAPLQIGAELYGHKGYQSDVEIISLMLETFARAKVEDVSIDLGHVGIFRGLIKAAGLDKTQETSLFNALQRKAVPEIRQSLEEFGVDQSLAEKILALSDLNGSDGILDEARKILAGSSEDVLQAIDYIEQVAADVCAAFPDLSLHYDLAELRGYKFHTGIVFSAYVPGSGIEVARGGRYDNIGSEFGRARAATGFSTCLKTMLLHSKKQFENKAVAIMAPARIDGSTEQQQQLRKTIDKLRAEGKRVIRFLPGQSGTPAEQGCNAELVYENDEWIVRPL